MRETKRRKRVLVGSLCEPVTSLSSVATFRVNCLARSTRICQCFKHFSSEVFPSSRCVMNPIWLSSILAITTVSPCKSRPNSEASAFTYTLLASMLWYLNISLACATLFMWSFCSMYRSGSFSRSHSKSTGNTGTSDSDSHLAMSIAHAIILSSCPSWYCLFWVFLVCQRDVAPTLNATTTAARVKTSDKSIAQYYNTLSN